MKEEGRGNSRIQKFLNLGNSAYTNTRILLCVFGDVIQARVDQAAPDSYVRVKVS